MTRTEPEILYNELRKDIADVKAGLATFSTLSQQEALELYDDIMDKANSLRIKELTEGFIDRIPFEEVKKNWRKEIAMSAHAQSFAQERG